jgi:hypothetical protein
MKKVVVFFCFALLLAAYGGVMGNLQFAGGRQGGREGSTRQEGMQNAGTFGHDVA